jgi:hypothetical protein
MLETLDEIRKAELVTGRIINGVDNANLTSVDSTAPIQTEVDELQEGEEKEEEKTSAEEGEGKPEEKELPAKKEDEEKETTDERDPVEKRIGKLTKRWRTAERERDFEKAKRLEVEEELKKLKSTIPETARPKREDFEDDDAYIDALTDWKIENKVKGLQEDSAKKTVEEKEQQTASEVEQELEEISDKGREKFSDYDQFVFDKDLALNQGMIETIILSEIAEDILYYLGKNPDLSAAISEMSTLKAAKEIGKIEVKLAEKIPEPSMSTEGKIEEGKKTLPVKKVTKTPEPITPVRSTGAIDKDPTQMSMKEYRAWRERNKG